MGLEEYQGMNVDQKLTVLCVKMDNIEKRLDAAPPCPSTRCGNHEERIGRLEDHEKIVVAVVSIGVIGSGIVAWALTRFAGG